MVQDSQAHAEEDQRKRAEVETRNQADNTVYTTEKLLQEHADKVPEDLKKEVEDKLSPLRTAIEANDVASMQSAMTDLNTSLQKLGQAVYSQANGASAEGPEAAGEEVPEDQGEGTVEGEFKEEN